MSFVLLLSAALCTLAQAPEGPQSFEIFVSPLAAPGGDGTREHPLASIMSARDLLRAEGNGAQDPSISQGRPTISLLDGAWELGATIEFGALDQGLLLRAAPGAHPRLVGGVMLLAPEHGGTFRPLDVAPERLAHWALAEDAWAFGYWFHDWAEEQLPVASIDPRAGTITLARPHRYGLKSGTSFYMTNLLSELDTPGEYYLDRTGKRLLIWPHANAAEITELVISTLAEPLLRMRATDGLEVRGLSLEYTRGPAVVVDGGHGVVIRDCRITGTGSTGIDLRGTDCAVLNCELREIGGTGVVLAGGDRKTLTPAGNRLQGSTLHGFGRVYRTYRPGVQVSGVGQMVEDNEFAHAPHSAIIFSGNEHLIKGNEIFDVLLETGDSGAIYCGRDWAMHGTRITGNFIHHLPGREGRWQNAIYLDDMASGIEVSRNVIWRCHLGMLIGGGRDLLIENNTFIECDLGIRFDARGVGWMAKNIADPRTSTLHKRLAEIPIDSEPWASRYPSLGRYLDDRFGRPVGSRVLGIRFYDTPFGSVVDRDCVVVEPEPTSEPARSKPKSSK